MLQVAKVWPVLLVLSLILVLALPAQAEQNQATTGTIKSVTAEQNQIVVTDKDGKDWSYQVKKDARCFVPNEDNAGLANLKAGEEVALLWEKGKGDQLQAHAILVRTGDFKNAGLAHGKVKSTDANDRSFTTSDADGKDMTFHMNDGAKIRLNDKEAKLNEIKANDRVIIVWEKSGDQNRALAVCTASEARDK
jgi:Cu/Ag efflux protein CusF